MPEPVRKVLGTDRTGLSESVNGRSTDDVADDAAECAHGWHTSDVSGAGRLSRGVSLLSRAAEFPVAISGIGLVVVWGGGWWCLFAETSHQ